MEKNTESTLYMFKQFKELGIDEINLTSLGNSISSGFSMYETIKPLFNRNESLYNVAQYYNIILNLYNMARAEKNNEKDVNGWLLNNISLQDMYNMNISDYIGSNKMGCANGKIDLDDYKLKGPNKRINDILLEKNQNLANIVVYHCCTGSFLDNNTRDGKHHLTNGIWRDLVGMEAILQYIENQNRTLGTNTQVYLGSAPNALGLHITDIINIPIKRRSKKYANTSFVKPVFGKTIKNYDGKFIYDIHYTDDEYSKLIDNINLSIADNYMYKHALINIDRELLKLSSMVEFTNKKLKYDLRFMYEEVERILLPWFDYIKAHNGNMARFIKLVTYYFTENYCYDYFYTNKNIVLERIKVYSK